MTLRRPSRLTTFDYVGCHRYFLTMCTLARRSMFSDSALVDVARLQLLRTAEDCGFAVLAYVFMPDHLHICVEGLHLQSDLRVFCKLMRKRCSSACWQFVRESLWQNGYHDRVLRDGEDVRGVLSYILMNPVRAGLVDRPDEYPHSWSVTFYP